MRELRLACNTDCFNPGAIQRMPHQLDIRCQEFANHAVTFIGDSGVYELHVVDTETRHGLLELTTIDPAVQRRPVNLLDKDADHDQIATLNAESAAVVSR